MTTLLIVLGALSLAVIGRGILDPLPSRDKALTEDQALVEERARMMEAISMSAI